MAQRLLMLFLTVFYCTCNHVNSLRLEKVLILSRHHLRTPFISKLQRMTPNKWPKWDVEAANLTPKGALLESYMGEYFSAWLKKEGLLPSRCPEEKDIHIYANTRERTRRTAIAFTEGAFQNCSIKVNFINSTEMDPIFNPVVHNTTEAFKQVAKQEMRDKLKNIYLKDAYLELNKITDIKNSKVCKEDGFCELNKDKDVIFFEVGEKPNVFGPIHIANSMIDTFLMSYYEGLPLQDIGWGKIKNKEQWKLLAKVLKTHMNVRFNLISAAKDLTKPLLKYFKERIDSEPKLTLLVGHNSNLTPMLSCMDFKPFVLPEQFEVTPIGGKLVFQKWTDGEKDLLKVEFVYQSWTQLRYAKKLSLSSPPKRVTLHLKKCVTDDNGFCPWSDFQSILNELVH